MENRRNIINSDKIYLTKIMKLNLKLKIKKIKSNNKYEFISFNFDKLYSYKELENIYYKLNNSKIVKLNIINKTVNNNNIYNIIIGKGKNITIFEAGIHAREIANPLFIIKFAIDLINKYENNDKKTIELLKNNKIIIIPLVNPDGYEAYVLGKNVLNKNTFLFKNYNNNFKCNSNGVDINRNFPSSLGGLYYKKNKLSSSISLIPSSNKHFIGYNLGSEIETITLIYLMYKYYKKMKLYVSLHSMGRVIYAGKPMLDDKFNKKCQYYGSLVSNINNYKLLDLNSEDEGYGADGTSTDFIAELINKYRFNNKTGRLEYQNKSIYKGSVILIESMNKITKNINLIKNEYYKYNLEKIYINLIKM